LILVLDFECKESIKLDGVAYFNGREYEDAVQKKWASLESGSGSQYDFVNQGLCHKYWGNPA
jgi:hypothetical protein